jgi:hypothetical protein
MYFCVNVYETDALNIIIPFHHFVMIDNARIMNESQVPW